jgi:hypothetical protein
MTVEQSGNEWVVTDSHRLVAGPFESNALAWRWIDRRTGDFVSPREKRSQWEWELVAKAEEPAA